MFGNPYSIRMNAISLDSIGIAAFGHDFGSLDGKVAEVTQIIDEFSSTRPGMLEKLVPLLQPVFPFLDIIPTRRSRLTYQLNRALGRIADNIIRQSRNSGNPNEKSVMHSLCTRHRIVSKLPSFDFFCHLVGAEDANKITYDEVLSQVSHVLKLLERSLIIMALTKLIGG